MKKYQIKVTYTKGQYEGQSFVLTKGGYVSKGGFQLPEFCYLSEKTAKAAVTRKLKNDKDGGWNYEVVEVE